MTASHRLNNVQLSVDLHVKDLISLTTLVEKMKQILHINLITIFFEFNKVIRL